MKNIFISVDFSKIAQKVALHTAKKAQLAEARVILFHVYEPTAVSEDMQGGGIYNERRVQARLDKLAHKLQKETGASVTRLMKPGSNTEEVLEVARIVKADLVIICHQNTTHYTSLALVHQQDLPILIVPITIHFDLQDFQARLTELLELPDHNAAPLEIL